MAQNLALVPAKDALVALLKGTMTAAYGESVDVQEAGNSDFDDDGQFVLQKVAIRVRFGDAAYGEARDISRTTLSAALSFQIICSHESLRGSKETRDRSLNLAGCAIEQLGGSRLVLKDGTRSEPILIRNVVSVSDKYGPVQDCWGVTIEVGGFAQFSGKYANGFGGNQ